ncbi:MAG: transposase, partial [Nitrososphaeraceae archaeon]
RMEEYVREDTSHINGIEGFWSYAKTWLYHYRGVPKQYFYLYLKEIEFRFNHRNEDIFRLLAKIMVRTVPTS